MQALNIFYALHAFVACPEQSERASLWLNKYTIYSSLITYFAHKLKNPSMSYLRLFLLLIILAPTSLMAQHFVGLRFQSYLNYFSRPEELDLAESPFTTATLVFFIGN